MVVVGTLATLVVSDAPVTDAVDGEAPKRAGAAHAGVDERAVHGATVRSGATFGFGTVFALGADSSPRLVSAAHVVDGVALVAGGSGPFAVVSGADLAAAPLASSGPSALTASVDAAVAGDLVVVAGHPGGATLAVRRGRVLAVADGSTFGQRADVVVIDARVEPGFSGGPVVDADGEVVAVMFAVEAHTGVGLAHPVAALDAAPASG